jgi:hypothetical protein
MTEKYNGWTNRETWLVNLWISNEESTHREPERIALECAEQIRNGEDDPYVDTFVRRLRIMFVPSLQEWAEETFLYPVTETGDTPCSGLIIDLLQTAWGAIDWDELAENTLADMDLEALEKGE